MKDWQVSAIVKVGSCHLERLLRHRYSTILEAEAIEVRGIGDPIGLGLKLVDSSNIVLAAISPYTMKIREAPNVHNFS